MKLIDPQQQLWDRIYKLEAKVSCERAKFRHSSKLVKWLLKNGTQDLQHPRFEFQEYVRSIKRINDKYREANDEV